MMQEQPLNHFFSVMREKKKSYDENYKFFAPKLAPKFSIFNFVRRDENALSYIIANLLDPNGDHAQGSVFIELFTQFIARKMSKTPNEKLKLIEESHKKAKCITESTTNNHRRIDIVIDFGNFGIGIENKPWAYDQKNQLKDYAEELRRRYGDNFLLVYLTGSNWDVSEYTISSEELANLNKNNLFLQITYQDLKEWIVDCEAKCQADRVRNFLRDFADYCDIQFGNGIEMSDENMLLEYSLETENNLNIALQIGRQFNEIRTSILKEFHSRIIKAIQEYNIDAELIANPNLGAERGKNYCFSLKNNNLINNTITFEYGNYAYWGIKKNNEKTPLLPLNIQEQILSKLKTHNLKGQNPEKNSNYFSIIGDFEKDLLFWAQNEETWIDMKFGNIFLNSIIEKYIDISNALKECNIII